MSMLSAQCNKLRKLADGIESRYGYPTAVKALRDAADTIWQLRNDLQRANAENARVRSELESVGIAAYLYGRDDLKAENAKLREFATETWELLTCNEPIFVWKGLREKARELGVDVG